MMAEASRTSRPASCAQCAPRTWQTTRCACYEPYAWRPSYSSRSKLRRQLRFAVWRPALSETAGERQRDELVPHLFDVPCSAGHPARRRAGTARRAVAGAIARARRRAAEPAPLLRRLRALGAGTGRPGRDAARRRRLQRLDRGWAQTSGAVMSGFDAAGVPGWQRQAGSTASCCSSSPDCCTTSPSRRRRPCRRTAASASSATRSGAPSKRRRICERLRFGNRETPFRLTARRRAPAANDARSARRTAEPPRPLPFPPRPRRSRSSLPHSQPGRRRCCHRPSLAAGSLAGPRGLLPLCSLRGRPHRLSSARRQQAPR